MFWNKKKIIQKQINIPENFGLKYEFTGETKIFEGRVLKRIRSICSFRNSCPIGTLGGWIEKESNLSHSGNCWVYGDGIVCDNSVVCDDVVVCGSGIVLGNSVVSGRSRIYYKVNFEKVESFNIEHYFVNYSGQFENEEYFTLSCQTHSIDTWNDETKRRRIMLNNMISENAMKSFLEIANEINLAILHKKEN